MGQLQKDLEAIESAGIRLCAISYDAVPTLKSFSDRRKVTFPLLSDPDSATIDAYGLRNTEVRTGSRQDGIAHPVTVLIDATGTVRAKLAYSVRRRHSTKELIAAAKKLD